MSHCGKRLCHLIIENSTGKGNWRALLIHLLKTQDTPDEQKKMVYLLVNAVIRGN
jgi:hypothetical protein